jgi:hypothetical protein
MPVPQPHAGVRKPLWYFLTPAYWFGVGGGGKHAVTTPQGLRSLRAPLPRDGAEEVVDSDVAAEEQAMRELLGHRTGAQFSGTGREEGVVR